MPQPAWLVAGPPGSGKSTFIRSEAQRRGVNLLHWNARVDRSLRDGRDRLHIQVRSREASILWIEGVEDLTQEAQAFLRRILETASPSVVCALEVRELWKMSSPILSRCSVISMKIDYSFRSKANLQKANYLGLIKPTNVNYESIKFKDLPALRKSGADPYTIFDFLLSNNNDSETITNDLIQSISAIGRGSSPWIQLANYLMRQEMK